VLQVELFQRCHMDLVAPTEFIPQEIVLLLGLVVAQSMAPIVALVAVLLVAVVLL
jgi:uncharacterized membrane protein YecN with MAPEG domain